MNYANAQERIKKISKLYRNATWFAIIFIVYFFNQFFREDNFDLSQFHISAIFIIWGLILSIRGINLFVFSPEWEKEIIEKEMIKENFHGKK